MALLNPMTQIKPQTPVGSFFQGMMLAQAEQDRLDLENRKLQDQQDEAEQRLGLTRDSQITEFRKGFMDRMAEAGPDNLYFLHEDIDYAEGKWGPNSLGVSHDELDSRFWGGPPRQKDGGKADTFRFQTPAAENTHMEAMRKGRQLKWSMEAAPRFAQQLWTAVGTMENPQQSLWNVAALERQAVLSGADPEEVKKISSLAHDQITQGVELLSKELGREKERLELVTSAEKTLRDYLKDNFKKKVEGGQFNFGGTTEDVDKNPQFQTIWAHGRRMLRGMLYPDPGYIYDHLRVLYPDYIPSASIGVDENDPAFQPVEKVKYVGGVRYEMRGGVWGVSAEADSAAGRDKIMGRGGAPKAGR